MHVDGTERDPIFKELDRLIKMMPPEHPAEEIEPEPQEKRIRRDIAKALRESGVPIGLGSVYARLKKGWTLEDAIHVPLTNPHLNPQLRPRTILPEGVSILQEIAKAGVEINTKAVYQRLDRGWSLHDAIHKPRRSNGKTGTSQFRL